MARTVAELPKGNRITDFISLGVVTKTFPIKTVKSVLAATGRESIRQRDLPAHVVDYYVIALALQCSLPTGRFSVVFWRGPVVAESFGENQGDGQVRHFPGT